MSPQLYPELRTARAMPCESQYSCWINEQTFIPGTHSLSWKEVGRSVSTKKSHHPVGPMNGQFWRRRHIGGIQQPSWIGVGALLCLPQPHNWVYSDSICFLFWFQQCSPTWTGSRTQWAWVMPTVYPLPDSDLCRHLSQWGASRVSALSLSLLPRVLSFPSLGHRNIFSPSWSSRLLYIMPPSAGSL